MARTEQQSTPQEHWLEAIQQPIRLNDSTTESVTFGFSIDDASPLYLRIEDTWALYTPAPEPDTPVYVLHAPETTWQLASRGSAEITSLLTTGQIKVDGAQVADVVIWAPLLSAVIGEIGRRLTLLQPPGKRHRHSKTALPVVKSTSAVSATNPQGSSEAAAARVQERTTETPAADETQEANSRFWRWRHTRPFYAGILTLLSGIFVVVGPASFLQFALLPGSNLWEGLIVGGLLIVMGLAQLLTPYYSTLVGGITIVLALVSLITSMGGLVVGLLFGLVGGALGVAWTPVMRPAEQGWQAAPQVGKAVRKV
ncbi:MAG: hypothetical protein IMW91_09035 [Firmicutes bacterium]|nr:hypothetical protein [Bacillota bacterium]